MPAKVESERPNACQSARAGSATLLQYATEPSPVIGIARDAGYNKTINWYRTCGQ